jgi:hypothetical protein
MNEEEVASSQLRLEKMLEEGRFEEAREFIDKEIDEPNWRIDMLINIYILTRDEQDRRRASEAIEKVSDPKSKDLFLAMLRVTVSTIEDLEPPLVAPEGTC